MGIRQELKPATIRAAFISALAEVPVGFAAGLKEPLDKMKGSYDAFNGKMTVNVSDVFHPYLAHPFHTALEGISWNTQPICLAAGLGAFIFHLYQNRKTEKPEHVAEFGALGSAKFADKDEVYKENDITNDPELGNMVLAKFQNKLIYLSERSFKNGNVAIIGGSGAGKSKSIMIPNIVHITDRSLIVTDPKGELYEETAATKKAQGYRVLLVNYKELLHSLRYNVLDYIRTDIDAKGVAEAIISNSSLGNKRDMNFWDKAEISLLQALILYVKQHLPKEHQHMGSVFELLISEKEYLHYMFLSLPRHDIARRAYQQSMSNLRGKTEGDVFQTLSASLDLWKFHEVCEFTEKSDFNFEDIGKEKTILYVIMPIIDKNMLPVIGCFFTQLFDALYYLADHHNNKLPVPVDFFFEEFNNIGKISNFNTIQSTCRGLGIGIKMIIQSIDQLNDRWGKEKASELLGNCDITFYLGGNDRAANKYFSELIGKTTMKINTITKSTGKQGTSTSSSYNYVSRQLREPDELRKIPHDDAILFIKGKDPIEIQKAWYDQIPEISDQMLGVVNRFDFKIPDRGDYTVFYPEDYIKDIVMNENDGKPLDIAKFKPQKAYIINTNDPEYHLKLAAEEKAEKLKKSKQKLDQAEEKLNKKSRKANKNAAVDSTSNPEPVENYAFPLTDADAPPEMPDDPNAFPMIEPPMVEQTTVEQPLLKSAILPKKPRTRKKKATVPEDSFNETDIDEKI